jgi:TPR repeat protein
VKALEYYRRVAEPNEDIDRASYLAPYVGEAFLAIGRYYRTGLPAAGLAEDKEKAARLFLRAAGNFKNADAQYELAMLYLNGDGVDKNPRLAVLWLNYSAQKRHALAQAEAGDLLWKGQVVKQARDRGLALLALALDNASPEELPLIEIKFRNAMAEADNETVLKAEEALKKLVPVMRVKTEGVLRILPGAAGQQIATQPVPESAAVVEAVKEPAKAGAATIPSLLGR